jgi:hypothetical protein
VQFLMTATNGYHQLPKKTDSALTTAEFTLLSGWTD